MELNNPGPRWIAYALASMVTTAALALIYFGSSALAPLLFETRTFRVDMGDRQLEVKQGATKDEVRGLFGGNFQERPTQLRRYREWLYRFEDGSYRFMFKDDRLESVGRGERRPRARTPGRRGRF